MRGLMFFGGSYGLCIENKLKSEVFNAEIHFRQQFKLGKLTKNLATFKR